MKKCSKCKIEKPLDDYHKRANRPCGVRSQCKKCYSEYPKPLKRRENYMRDYNLKSYGIDITDYNIMFENQKGCCKICNTHISELNLKIKKSLCVDHNHETGKVRGLLCDKCNRGLGLFCDDENLLYKAMEYLNRNN